MSLSERARRQRLHSLASLRRSRATQREEAHAGDSNQSVAQYLESWLEGKRALRVSTQLAYATHIRLYLAPHLGEIRLAELGAEDVDAMYRDMIDANPNRARPIGASTLTRVHATLMSALGTAVRRGLIDRNPTATVELPRAVRREHTVWSADQLAAFLEAAGDDEPHPLFLLLAMLGLRRGEAVGLRWSDVDLGSGMLHVRQQLVAVGGEVIAGEPKSRAGHRVVALDTATVTLLECLRREQERREEIAMTWTDSGLVFTTASGGALDPTRVSRRFDTLVAACALPRIRLHDLRHTSASIGLESGESLIEVSRRLGHSSIAVTADIYSEVSTDAARQAAERRSRLIFRD